MKHLLLLAAMVGAIQALTVPIVRNCAQEHRSSGLSSQYYENIAHNIHSMTVQGLRMYNPKAGAKNFIPTVNLNVSAPIKVLPHAPDDGLPADFSGSPMRRIDKILSHVGVSDDGLGENWSPIERVAHVFHMLDLWEAVHQEYTDSVVGSPPSDSVCRCLTNVKDNGVEAGVGWVANHYKRGTPITLLNRPIPKLTDAKTWSVWRNRLLYYYTTPALHDAAMYMHCATKDL